MILRIYPLPIGPGGMVTIFVCVVTTGESVGLFADSVNVDSFEDVVVSGAITVDSRGCFVVGVEEFPLSVGKEKITDNISQML